MIGKQENNSEYWNRFINADCREHLLKLEKESIHLVLSDIPYGIGIDEWDVLHNNTNSGLLGQSPAQRGKKAFKTRGKPIRGWSTADRSIGKEYQDWCDTWTRSLYEPLKEGASLFIFGARRTIHRAILSFEDSGFILKDLLSWKKSTAHHRAQKLSVILEKRKLHKESKEWEGWKLGNLAPIWEPVAWMFKPYRDTITDNVLKNGVGAMNIEDCLMNGKSPTNVLEFDFDKNEKQYHQAQKPVKLLEYFINLTTKANYVVLDPFAGSGSTLLACKNANRNFIGFEINKKYWEIGLKRLEKKTFNN